MTVFSVLVCEEPTVAVGVLKFSTSWVPALVNPSPSSNISLSRYRVIRSALNSWMVCERNSPEVVWVPAAVVRRVVQN